MINLLSLVLFDAVTWPYWNICLSHYILCIPQSTWYRSRNLIQMSLLSMSWLASWDKVTICTMYSVTNIVPLKRSTGVSYRLLEVSWAATGKLKETLALSQIKMLTIQMSFICHALPFRMTVLPRLCVFTIWLIKWEKGGKGREQLEEERKGRGEGCKVEKGREGKGREEEEGRGGKLSREIGLSIIVAKIPCLSSVCNGLIIQPSISTLNLETGLKVSAQKLCPHPMSEPPSKGVAKLLNAVISPLYRIHT